MILLNQTFYLITREGELIISLQNILMDFKSARHTLNKKSIKSHNETNVMQYPQVDLF